MGSKTSKHGKKPSTKQTRKQLSTAPRTEPVTEQLPTSRTESPDTDDGKSVDTKKLQSRFIL